MPKVGTILSAARAALLDYLDRPVSIAGGGLNVLLDSLYLGVTVSSAALANTFGSWAELYADVGLNKTLYFLVVTTVSVVGTEWELEIGEGALGAEAAIIRVCGRYFYLSNVGILIPFIFPMARTLTNNARLSVRARDDSAAAYDFSIHALKG